MNINKLIKTAVAIIALAGLTSCSNLLADKNENTSDKTNVTFGFADSNARTVNAAYTINNLTDIKISYKKAGDTEETVIVSGKNYSDLTSGKYKAELKPGTYSFYASAKIAEMNFSGAVENKTISSAENSVTFSLGVSSYGTDSGTGYINIGFALNDANVTAVKGTLYNYGDGSVKIAESALTIDGANPASRTFSYKIGEGSALGESIEAGTYRLILEFYAGASGETKIGYYSEIINVSGGLTSRAERTLTEVGTARVITIDLDGGTLANGVTIPEVVTKNTGAVTLPTNTQVTKEGYNFIKWIDASDTTETAITSISPIGSNITVKAVWEEVLVEYVSIDSALSLAVSGTKTLTAIVLPSSALNKKLTWTSSDPSIATVSESGLVTAVASGSATITATSVNGKTATCTVNVTTPADFSFTLAAGSDITVTESNKVLTADEGYTDYKWFVDGTVTSVTTNTFDCYEVLTESGIFNITVEAKKNGEVYSSSIFVSFTYDPLANLGNLYFMWGDSYMQFDTDTGEVINVWYKPLYDKCYVPSAADYASQLDTLLDGNEEVTIFDSETEEYSQLETIINDLNTVCYDIEYYYVTDSFKAYGFRYVDDIYEAFPNKSDPILPEDVRGHDVFYFVGPNVIIFDLTGNKVHWVDGTDAETTDNEIIIGSVDDLCIKEKTDFPDLSKAQSVTEAGTYQICSEGSEYEVGKVVAEPTGFESSSNSPVYKTPDSKYFLKTGL